VGYRIVVRMDPLVVGRHGKLDRKMGLL
jgi:hypothetical protein